MRHPMHIKACEIMGKSAVLWSATRGMPGYWHKGYFAEFERSSYLHKEANARKFIAGDADLLTEDMIWVPNGNCKSLVMALNKNRIRNNMIDLHIKVLLIKDLDIVLLVEGGITSAMQHNPDLVNAIDSSIIEAGIPYEFLQRYCTR